MSSADDASIVFSGAGMTNPAATVSPEGVISFSVPFNADVTAGLPTSKVVKVSVGEPPRPG